MDLRLSRSQIVSCYDDLARAGRFPDNTYLHQSLLQLISPHFEDLPPIKILDAGGGAGFFGIDLATMGHQLVMLDISEEALSVARKRSFEKNKNAIAICGDVENLPFQPQSFDSIVCIFVFSHLNNPKAAFEGFRRVLREDGSLIVSFENKIWHILAAGLQEKYDEAISLLSSSEPIIKAYDILPPVRLYSVPEIENPCQSSGFHDLEVYCQG